MKRNIMIIEDEQEIREELEMVLLAAGYEVAIPETLEHVPEQVHTGKPDLILLDIQLPFMDGYEICREIRKFSKVPIIFVTARNTAMDELKSLMTGGDDYIVKPYHVPILMTRIKNLLARVYHNEEPEQSRIVYRDVILELLSGKIIYAGKETTLTRNELKILYYLFSHPGDIVPRVDLIEYLWENELYIDDNTLSVHITRLRNKLKDIGAGQMIETRRGMGYQI
ncbi:response regulator transcription factor [Ruminococcus sp. OA3]|uniref:response regulator transcription factor n=1 Tax=Ruminococcus sp. OA3 TaxID=2914164 RepID=UPI001F068CF5|nr:response regulator transcription factor [Ruminococcus sp. OA3]MCH1983373.1 response regulator transcription factor [Ruminococcus sp. OA3]